jgi:hypothetical protein
MESCARLITALDGFPPQREAGFQSAAGCHLNHARKSKGIDESLAARHLVTPKNLR